MATERVAWWLCALVVVNTSTLSWVCAGTTQTRTGSGCRNVDFRSSTRMTWTLTARAAMQLLARVVVKDVDVFVHSAAACWNWCGWPLASLHHVTGLVGGNELG